MKSGVVKAIVMTESSEKLSSLMEKLSEKVHGGSDSESGKEAGNGKSRFKRLFGREKPVHKLLGGGKGEASGLL